MKAWEMLGHRASDGKISGIENNTRRHKEKLAKNSAELKIMLKAAEERTARVEEAV